jgi:hypothetical protein
MNNPNGCVYKTVNVIERKNVGREKAIKEDEKK